MESISDKNEFLPPPPTPLELTRKTLYVFDFDGTLVGTEPRPTDVGVDPQISSDLENAAQRFKVVVCSGRGIFDLLRLLKECPSLDLIGSHGAQWWLSRERKVRELPGPDWEKWRLHAIPLLDSEILIHDGELEDKRASLTLHYKNSGTEWWSKRAHWLESLADGPAELLGGLDCWNLIPRGFSKGNALAQYMMQDTTQHAFENVIYFGDELTDESVFTNWKLKNSGLIGVKVGPGSTAATKRLPDVKAVRNWLSQLSNCPCPKAD